MTDPELTPEQEEQALQIEQELMSKAREEIRTLSRLIASKEDAELFGETEFQIRDHLHEIGNQAVDLTLKARKKKDTPDAV